MAPPVPEGIGRPGFWVVTGYDEVVGLGRCPHVLASGGEHGGVSGLGPGDEFQEIEDGIARSVGAGANDLMAGETAMLLTLDPPDHTAYRKIVNKGFTPRSIAALEAAVRDLTRELLDGTRRATPTSPPSWPCHCRWR